MDNRLFRASREIHTKTWDKRCHTFIIKRFDFENQWKARKFGFKKIKRTVERIFKDTNRRHPHHIKSVQKGKTIICR